jgi:hypothetical protein
VSPIEVSLIMFACVFAGAMLGMFLRVALPEQHQNTDSKDVLKLLIGLIGTMTALVIGLLIATAASSYATRRTDFIQMSASIVLLDRELAHYGPETKEVRDLLRRVVTRELQVTWSETGTSPHAKFDPSAARGDILFDKIQELEPQNDVQRSLKAQLLTTVISLGQTRWLLFEQSGSSIPIPFLVVLVIWLSLIFASFGLFAPPNATVVVALLLGALSVSGAIFLILELDLPFEGLIRISDEPLREALAHLGQ